MHILFDLLDFLDSGRHFSLVNVGESTWLILIQVLQFLQILHICQQSVPSGAHEVLLGCYIGARCDILDRLDLVLKSLGMLLGKLVVFVPSVTTHHSLQFVVLNLITHYYIKLISI